MWSPRSLRPLNARQTLGSRFPLGPLGSHSWWPRFSLYAL